MTLSFLYRDEKIFFLPLCTLIISLIIMTSAFAGSLPGERLHNPALESRAEHIFTQLRCLVCQNETIADSDARIARDLRLLVRTRLKKGDSDQEIIDFVHGRYGDYVLMKPPLQKSTLALWFSPLMILIIGIMTVAGILHRQRVKPQP